MNLIPLPTLSRKRALAIAIGLVAALAAVIISSRMQHRAYRIILSDGTKIYYRAHSSIAPAAGYPHPREIHLDGDFYIESPAGVDPLQLRSRLLRATVTGAAKLRMAAFSDQPGEEIDLLAGHAQVMKAYDSPYREPDILEPGEMSMVNKDIDLMEKERLDPAELRHWVEALVAAADGSAAR